MSLFASGLSPRIKGFPNRKPEQLLPFSPALVEPEWGWFWGKCRASWALSEGGGPKTFSFGKNKVEGSFQADTIWKVGPAGFGVDGASGGSDPRILVPDNSVFSFTNDFSITGVFFDDGTANTNAEICGKVSSNWNDYRLSVNFNSGSQTIRWRAGASSGRDLTFGGGGGNLDILHNKISVLMAVQSPTLGKELWHNGVRLANNASDNTDLPTGTNTFALLDRGSVSLPWLDNGPVYGVHFHQPALTASEHIKLAADPSGPFRTSVRPLFLPAVAGITHIPPKMIIEHIQITA